MYAPKAVAQRYGVTVQSVLWWIHAGELRAINVGRVPGAKRARWKISEEALAAFEERRAKTPPPPRTSRKRRPADVVRFY
jgi:hypothetical protein